ncbi:hypothetical protein GC722_06075 [Auraticoccus sp. F435]|uniref:Uncharacterized protein n=1 Tax=Auraticoccus cholistanensis TaxID=2656650 RepID=A0A6A9US27_9ACTN|nr:hypothetical protein [Auraticoccus cholistanensis]MVA75593.1 hypothetical protein [Auraticoccus cholistanensis]
MSESATPEPGAVPTSDLPEVDAALREVADLSSVPLEEHHRRLERAHEVLHAVLDRARGGS